MRHLAPDACAAPHDVLVHGVLVTDFCGVAQRLGKAARSGAPFMVHEVLIAEFRVVRRGGQCAG